MRNPSFRKALQRSMVRRPMAAVASFALTGSLLTFAPPARADIAMFYLPGTSPTPPLSEAVTGAAIGALVKGLIPSGQVINQVGYPASLAPATGSMALDPSVAQGEANMLAAIAKVPDATSLMLFGVSQGSVVLTYVENALIAAGHPSNVTFVRIMDPSGPTGLLGRNAGLVLPGMSFVEAPRDSPYNTVVYVHQYDVFADWPADQLNLLADLNAVAGGILYHNYAAYNIDVSTLPANDVTTNVNSRGATTTTYFIPADGLLPLLQIAKNAGVSDQIVNALQPLLKPTVDAAYVPRPPQAHTLQKIFQAVVNSVVSAGTWAVHALTGTAFTTARALSNLSAMLNSAGTQLERLSDPGSGSGSAAATKTAPNVSPVAAAGGTAAKQAAAHGRTHTSLNRGSSRHGLPAVETATTATTASPTAAGNIRAQRR